MTQNLSVAPISKRNMLEIRMLGKIAELEDLVFSGEPIFPKGLTKELFFEPIENHFSEKDTSSLRWHRIFFAGQVLLMTRKSIASFEVELASIARLAIKFQKDHHFYGKKEYKERYESFVQMFHKKTVGEVFEPSDMRDIVELFQEIVFPEQFSQKANKVSHKSLIKVSPYRSLLSYVDPDLSMLFRKIHILSFLLWMKNQQ